MLDLCQARATVLELVSGANDWQVGCESTLTQRVNEALINSGSDGCRGAMERKDHIAQV